MYITLMDTADLPKAASGGVAQIQIREEIRAVKDGRLDRDDTPLRKAPHAVSTSEWAHACPCKLAAFPLPSLKQQKYWPPV